MGTTTKYALAGIARTFREQRNMRNHAAGGLVAVVAGFAFGISRAEWLAIVIAIGLVLSAELMNTAVEATVDLVTEEWRELAKVAKDAAAGAVLLSAATALVVAGIVFLPRIFG